MAEQSSLPATQRALVQEVYAQPLVVKNVPTPQPTPGSLVVKVLYANVISYMGEIFNGNRKYPYPTPMIPGSSAVGRVAAIGPDTTFLKPGQLVLVDITFRGRDDPSAIFLSAIIEGFTEGSRKLMHGEWRNGSYAEYYKVPIENCHVLDEARLLGSPSEGGLGLDIKDLMILSKFLVSYGGLVDINLKPGETVIVAPATGGFGGGAVHVALAMGAGRVIAMGRNVESLRALAASNPRVVTVPITSDVDSMVKELSKYGPIDAFFDISPPEAKSSQHIKACILALRHSGRVSLMGGIRDDIALPYTKIMHFNLSLRGKWMFEREDVARLIKMVETGILTTKADTDDRCVGTFGLEQWKEAFDLAAKHVGSGFVLLKP